MAAGFYERICSSADSKSVWMRKQRQDFHKYAESGWHEVRTCSIIAEHLVKLGYTDLVMGKDAFKADARMGLPSADELDNTYRRALDQGAVLPYAEIFKGGFTGICATLDTGRPGPVIGFRQDIDALGVLESRESEHRPAREGFSSVNDGWMHACGHDAHAVIGMALAELLTEFKDELCGKVKLVFQPAEEGVRGARGMVEAGLLDDVDHMFCLHMGARPKGDTESQIGIGKINCFSLANAKLDICFHGDASHAFEPENGNNAMLAAFTAGQAIYGIPRCSLGGSTINIGQITGGTGRNVVCDEVKMVMELRGWTQESLVYIEEYTRRIVAHAAAMHGCTSDIELKGATVHTKIDEPAYTEEMIRFAKALAFKTFGPSSGIMSDDFSYMAKRVYEHGGKVLTFQLLSDVPAPFHSTRFDIDEDDLPTGLKFEAACMLRCMGLM